MSKFNFCLSDELICEIEAINEDIAYEKCMDLWRKRTPDIMRLTSKQVNDAKKYNKAMLLNLLSNYLHNHKKELTEKEIEKILSDPTSYLKIAST